MKVCNDLMQRDLRFRQQCCESLSRVFRHVLLLDLSVLEVNFKFDVPYLVSSVFYRLT